MNRAFFIVFVPAVLVAAAYTAVFYGKVVPRPLALSVAAIAVVALLVGRFRQQSKAGTK